jgi:integrase
MASLFRLADGRKRIQFYDGNGKRRSVGLGSISNRNAERIRDKVEQLVEHRVTQTPLDQSVSRWLAKLDGKLHAKLVQAGLVKRQDKSSSKVDSQIPLKGFLDSHLAKRTDLKPATVTFYGHTFRNLISFFGATKPIAEITEGDADDFRRYLNTSEKLSEATVNRRCNLAKTLMRTAVRHRVIPVNPFQDMSAGVSHNAERQRFIERSTIDCIIESAPDAEWKLLIALARYGGLRMPSEPLSLQWNNIDWQQSRMQVPSPKTEHHHGKSSRTIPLFPELRPYLEDVFDQAEAGTDFVITRHRPESVRNSCGNWHGVNLRTQFQKIIRRAGFDPWPRLWQNLRASRETELAQQYGLYVATAWIGNSAAVAAKHYLQVTDADFAEAVAPKEESVRKPVRYSHASPRTSSQPENDQGRFSVESNKKRPRARTRDRSLWAMQESNLRLPPCEDGTLAAELIALWYDRFSLIREALQLCVPAPVHASA